MAPNIDAYDRPITYLRVSVTDRCNLRCFYCMPANDFHPLKHTDILTYEEILRLIHVATDAGVTKVRLTGGEPLLRRDFVHFVESVCRIPLLQDVSLTTNGILLKELAQPLFDAGLHRINVSLDTLNPSKYAKIAGRPFFQAVWEGLETAESLGFSPIKINVVTMKGVNDDELRQFADLSIKKPYHVRFIEYMPVGRDSDWKPERYISSDEIRARLAAFSSLHPIPRSSHDGPAERYRFKSGKGEIGLISAISHHFCPSCNRLRLTADGRLRPCLFSNEEVDIKTPLRLGQSREELKSVFKKTIAKKPRRHHVQAAEKGESLRPMISIGG
jgi:cyclic pyranopterin phosphate synthase